MIGEDLKPHLSQLSSSKVSRGPMSPIVLFIFQRSSRSITPNCTLFILFSLAEAVESIHQACPVWLQWQRAPIGGSIGWTVPSHQTSIELQFCPPGTETTLELTSAHPELVHRSKLLTLTHTVCVHSHIKVHTALIDFPGSREDQGDVGLLLIVSDDPLHPDSIEQLHTPSDH